MTQTYFCKDLTITVNGNKLIDEFRYVINSDSKILILGNNGLGKNNNDESNCK